MVHKLRRAVGRRDDKHTLEGMVEMDEGCFSIEASGQAHKTQKAGRGSKARSNVMVMAESTMLEDIDTGKADRQCGCFKAKVLDGHKTKGTGQSFVESTDEDQTMVFTGKSTSHANMSDYAEIHITGKSSGQATRETLKWVHMAIGNAKRNFVGTS